MTSERFIELAEENVLRSTEAQVKRVQSQAFSETLLHPGQYRTLQCEDCGEDLHEFRMQRGLLRCVDCQNTRDQRGKHYTH
jgi:hypothetical protein